MSVDGWRLIVEGVTFRYRRVTARQQHRCDNVTGCAEGIKKGEYYLLVTQYRGDCRPVRGKLCIEHSLGEIA